jgi:hypothetical protein
MAVGRALFAARARKCWLRLGVIARRCIFACIRVGIFRRPACRERCVRQQLLPNSFQVRVGIAGTARHGAIMDAKPRFELVVQHCTSQIAKSGERELRLGAGGRRNRWIVSVRPLAVGS